MMSMGLRREVTYREGEIGSCLFLWTSGWAMGGAADGGVGPTHGSHRISAADGISQVTWGSANATARPAPPSRSPRGFRPTQAGFAYRTASAIPAVCDRASTRTDKRPRGQRPYLSRSPTFGRPLGSLLSRHGPPLRYHIHCACGTGSEATMSGLSCNARARPALIASSGFGIGSSGHGDRVAVQGYP